MKLTATSGAAVRVSKDERIQRYIDATPAAISGQEGHNQTFKLACNLFHGFALTESETLDWLNYYNSKCQPPWSDSELRHKAKSAANASHSKPRGHRLGYHDDRTPCPAPRAKPAKVEGAKVDPCAAVESFLDGYSMAEEDAAESSPIRLAEDWRQDSATLISHIYQPGEQVNIVVEYTMSKGKANPDGVGLTLDRDKWVERLGSGFMGSDAGGWIRMNPMDGKGVADKNVTACRFILLESDDVPQDLWLSLMFKLSLPVAALIDSGGKSIHAWIKVDCSSPEEYRETFKRLQGLLERYGVDKKNKNPGRLSRLPGVVRNIPTKGQRQRLLYLNPNPAPLDWAALEGELGQSDDEPDEPDHIMEIYRAGLYVPGEEITEPEVIFSLQGVDCCTAGNISTVFAAEGAGKSAVVGAMLAAALAQGQEVDCLGWVAKPVGDKCIIHIDTEQSIEHRAKAIRRIAHRAGLPDASPNLASIRVHGQAWTDARAVLDYAIKYNADKFGGIHSIFIDGPGDMVPSVNDEPESNTLVAMLMSYAEEYDTHIVNVIHLNHASLNDAKMRGHLGSQLARKSETTIKIAVKDEVRTVFAPKTRNAPIPLAKGARFKWSETHRMFVSMETLADERDADALADARKQASEAFKKAGESTLSQSELGRQVSPVAETGRSKVKKWISTGILLKHPDKECVACVKSGELVNAGETGVFKQSPAGGGELVSGLIGKPATSPAGQKVRLNQGGADRIKQRFKGTVEILDCLQWATVRAV